MTGQTVLIAAYSGRTLAQSARRAGYLPLVVDTFSDTDMRGAAHTFAVLPDAVKHGFQGRTLLDALCRLARAAPSKPIGIVLGSGFEGIPRLIATLDREFGVRGCSASTVQKVKDPVFLSKLLKELAIPFPETRTSLPADQTDSWVTKQIGGCGGTHIRHLTAGKSYSGKQYFQRRLSGQPMSVLAIPSKAGTVFEVSRQWCTPSAKRPYRYGGAVSIGSADNPAAQTMIVVARKLCEALDLHGLISFDFIVENNRPWLLEINPRPGATIDIFDDPHGTLFEAQVRPEVAPHYQKTAQYKASAILYADRGTLSAPDIAWPDWACDRPMPGTIIHQGDPMCSVQAEDATPHDAQCLAAKRLEELSNLLYEAPTKVQAAAK